MTVTAIPDATVLTATAYVAAILLGLIARLVCRNRGRRCRSHWPMRALRFAVRLVRWLASVRITADPWRTA